MVWIRGFHRGGIFLMAYPVYLASRIFGFLPCTILYNRKNGSSKIVVTFTDVLWFIISLALYTSAMIFNMFYNYHALLTESVIIIIGGRLLLLTGNLNAIFSILMDMYHRHEIWKIIQHCHQFDKEVSENVYKIFIIKNWIFLLDSIARRHNQFCDA